MTNIVLPAQNVAIQTPQALVDPTWYEKLKVIESNINTLFSGAPGTLMGQWKAYTPTAVPFTGAFGAYTTAGRYRQVGKTVNVAIQLTITTNGTAAGNIQISLPLIAYSGSGALYQVMYGREIQIVGHMLQGAINPGGTTVFVYDYTNSYAGGTGYVLDLAGTYETN
jgi:hypothetical protein